MRVSVYEVANQKVALRQLADLTSESIDWRVRQAVCSGIDITDEAFMAELEKSTVAPDVRNAALAIVNDCDKRDDDCEIHAIYNAVKYGNEHVKGLEKGLKYMSDPRWADFFSTPSRTLKQLAQGYNGEDCDGFSALLCSLLGSLGFAVGLRVWGEQKGEYTHVYALVAYPKVNPSEWIALDATVDEAEVGWEPEGGYTFTAVLDGT